MLVIWQGKTVQMLFATVCTYLDLKASNKYSGRGVGRMTQNAFIKFVMMMAGTSSWGCSK